MARTAWPTVSSSQLWTAANFNLYGRDNDQAYWPYLAAGDIAYGATSTTLAKLGIGENGAVLTSTGSALSWTGKNQTSGMISFKSKTDYAPGQTFSSTWADITGATVTLTITGSATYTVLVLATVTGYNTAAGSYFSIRSMVGGVADANPAYQANSGATINRNEAMLYSYYATGVAAGSVIVKLQCQKNTNDDYVTQGRLIALSFAE